jgi:ABC-2 type transport system permease protein
MNAVLKSLRLDYYAFKANYKAFAIIYALAIYLSLYTQPTIVIVIVMIFSSIFSGMTFLVWERNHLSKLYGILPLGRMDVVIGRYLHALIFGIINCAVAGMVTVMVSLISNKGGMDAFSFTAYISVFFLYFCLSIGVSFPIYYKFGVIKAAISMILPLYLVVMSGIFISRNVDSISSLKQIIEYLAYNPTMMWVAGIGLGLLLLVISCPVSCLIYKRSEL